MKKLTKAEQEYRTMINCASENLNKLIGTKFDFNRVVEAFEDAGLGDEEIVVRKNPPARMFSYCAYIGDDIFLFKTDYSKIITSIHV